MARPAPRGPREEDAAAVSRSYGFLVVASVVMWAISVAVAMSVAGGAGSAVAAALTVALCGWLLFLRGLRRRDLERVKAPRPPRDEGWGEFG